MGFNVGRVLGYEMNDIKRLKIPYDVPPSMHYSKIQYWRSFLISLLPSSRQSSLFTCINICF